MRGARVLDGLVGEEEGLGGIWVEAAVERLLGCVGGVGGEFEEEDYAVDGREGREG